VTTLTTVTSPSSTALTLQSAGLTTMTLATTGYVGIGTTSPSYNLDVSGSNQTTIARTYSGTTAFTQYIDDSFGGVYLSATAASGTNAKFLAFQTYPSGGPVTERMRIDSSGNLLVGTTAQINGERLNVTGSTANQITRLYNSNSSPNGLGIFYSTATPNTVGNSFIYASDATTYRFIVQSNGGIYNYSANNSNLSDERLKKDIQLSGNYLDKLCAIPVKTFLFNDQTDQELNLGVIAQDVLAAAPELVDKDGWGEKAPDGTPYMAIYETDLKYAMLKAIQELKTLVDAQAAEITALKSKVGA